MQKKCVSHYSILLGLLFVLHQSAVYGQQRFSAGPRLGINLADFTGVPAPTKAITGLTAGGFIMYSSLNHFGISADLLYAQKGASIQGVFNTTQRISYLELPIALRYFLTRSGNFRPNLFAGPAIGFKLNATQTDRATNAKQDISGSINAVDLGIMAGFQLNFKGLGNRQRFLIDGRYTYGLSGIRNLTGLNEHNSVFTVTLGYGFGVGPEFRSGRRR